MSLGIAIIVPAMVTMSACVYLTPYGVAIQRKHLYETRLLFLNLFLGWTIIGWFILFAWAWSGPTKPRREGN